MKMVIVLLLAITVSSFAQQRILVSPNNEVIPLGDNAKAIEIARRFISSKASQPCLRQFTFGATPESYPTNFVLGAHHKDVLGMWFIAKATGTIDTLFWLSGFSVGALDSLVSIRIFKSNIYPGHGPGDGNYPPPCTQWGFYYSVNDYDQGISPFRDQASDSQWVSTLEGQTPSFDPLGEELWGSGGYLVKVIPNSINALALNELGQKPHIQTGEPFFITMQVNSLNDHPESPFEEWTQTSGSDFRVTTSDEIYPSRVWKFYEHDSGPSSCNNLLQDQVKRGWIVRGGFSSNDSLNVAVYNWWYVMTLDSTATPPLSDTSTLIVTNNNIRLCFEYPCASALDTLTTFVFYRLDNGIPQNVQPEIISRNSLCIDIPIASPGHTLCYTLFSSDSNGMHEIYPERCSNILVLESSDKGIAVPLSFALHPNYPNPFNPSTRIEYDLPKRSKVTLTVIDVLGREVGNLVDEIQDAGFKSVLWDASNIVSGVYFYRLITESFTETRKMLLLQ